MYHDIAPIVRLAFHLLLIVGVGALAMAAWYLREWRTLWDERPTRPTWRQRIADGCMAVVYAVGATLVAWLERPEPPRPARKTEPPPVPRGWVPHPGDLRDSPRRMIRIDRREP